MKKILYSKNIWKLILKSLIIILIPYAYLLLSGLILDKWLKLHNLTVFTGISYLTLEALAVVLVIIMIILFIKSKSTGKRKKR